MEGVLQAGLLDDLPDTHGHRPHALVLLPGVQHLEAGVDKVPGGEGVYLFVSWGRISSCKEDMDMDMTIGSDSDSEGNIMTVGKYIMCKKWKGVAISSSL